MKTSVQQDLAAQMNALGSQREPFFFIVDFLGEHFELIPLKELPDHNIQIDFGGTEHKKNDIKIEQSPMAFDLYEEQFQKVKEEISYGNSYLCNLTTATPIQTQASLEDIYHAAKAKYKILYKDNWLCFSPETFVKLITVASAPIQ